MFKIGVMASGGGSNFQCILDRIADSSLQAQCEFLLTNNSRCGAAQKAHDHGVPCYHVSSITHPVLEDFTQAMLNIVNKHKIDLLVLAGYMKKVPDALLERFPERVINIHPALLPAFGGPGHYGSHVHEAVVAAGVKISGPTVHFVDSVYDHGKIISQRAVPVFDTDLPTDVAGRVLEAEHDLYWRVIQAFAENQVQVENGKVRCPVR